MSEPRVYRVPTMVEIAALQKNGFRVASTFSGCGGSSLGYRMAGFEVIWASEFVEAARETYRANASPTTVLDERDIRNVTAEEIMEQAKIGPGDLDIFDGSPPCSSFSTAGKREAGWKEVKKYSDKVQRTDDLFYEYVRLIDGLQPKTFVAENVSGLVRGTAKGYFLDILRAMKACGYRVDARILDASWLGVPQMRQRLIFVGVREDLCRDYGVAPTHPKPRAPRYSIRDACPWIQQVSARNDSNGFGRADVPVDGPAPTVRATDGDWERRRGTNMAVEAEADISRYAIGAEWEKIGGYGQSEKFFQLVRPHPDYPCPTITATTGQTGAAGVTHPFEKRKFSVAELRRICGFPDDFVLTGSYSQQVERLGRAVPPVMMSKIAETIRDEVLMKIRAVKEAA